MKAHRWIVPSAAALFVGLMLLATTPALADPPPWPYPDGAPGFIPCPPGAPTTTCTASSSHHETDLRTDLPNAQAYSTQVIGYAYMTGPGLFQDIVAFDHTTPNAPGSAVVLGLFDQATLAAHNAALALAAGRPFIALMETSPELVASSSTTGPKVQVSHAPHSANPQASSTPRRSAAKPIRSSILPTSTRPWSPRSLWDQARCSSGLTRQSPRSFQRARSI